jgi:hypothetical protein
MKKVILAALFSLPAFAQPNLYCSQGDWNTRIEFTPKAAVVEQCNTDWGCNWLTLELKCTFSNEKSDSTFNRYICDQGGSLLEVSTQLNQYGQFEVKLSSDRFGTIGNCQK